MANPYGMIMGPGGYWEAEDDLLNDANSGWGLTPGTQVLGGNNPYMGGTPPATSSYIGAKISHPGTGPVPFSGGPMGISLGGPISPSMAPSIGLEPGGMAGPGSGTDPTTHGVGPAIYGTGTLGGKFSSILGGLTSDIGTSETYGPAFVDTYSDMMAGKPSSGVDTAHTGSYYASGTSPVDAAKRVGGVTSAEFRDLFSDRDISIDSPELASALASIAASSSPVAGPYGVPSAAVTPSGWITPDIDPDTARMLTGRVHAVNPEDISVVHSPHATIASLTERTANIPFAGTTKLTVRDVIPALANADINVANTIAEQIAETQAQIDAMGLTGATAQAAQQAITGSSGYVTADQLAGLVAAQQEQDRAVAAAAAAAAAASAASSGGDWGGEDTGVSAGPAGAPQGAHHAGSAASKAVDRAVQNAIIDALVSSVDPYGSDLSAEYGDLGYGGGFGEGHGDTGPEGMGGWT